MKNNDELVRLEQLVETLISRCKEQKDKILALEKKLRDRDEECELVKMESAELQKQRTEIGSRVSGLLERIEAWETDLADKKAEKGK
jgi:chromosome segregation ATPase